MEDLPNESTLRFYKKGYRSIDDVPYPETYPETGDAITDPIRMADAGVFEAKSLMARRADRFPNFVRTTHGQR